jgi:uncharacterized protein involved in propanediol utilization
MEPGEKLALDMAGNPDEPILGRRAEFAERVVGYGKSFASFGEIAQGRLSSGSDFLCTMPINLWSTCKLTCTPIRGPLVVECDLKKSRDVVSLTLEHLGITKGYYMAVEFTRNIPIGKGLSSSTADMLAAIRATQEVFGFLLKETFISRLMAAIEPHDALHYNSSVAYDHRRGVLLHDFGHVPQWWIVAADDGGELNTVHYNRHVKFTDQQIGAYDELFHRLRTALTSRDDRAVAACATESARMHAEFRDNRLLKESLVLLPKFEALGLIATHSGTCAGFLFPPNTPASALERIRAEIARDLGRGVFTTRSLALFD